MSNFCTHPIITSLPSKRREVVLEQTVVQAWRDLWFNPLPMDATPTVPPPVGHSAWRWRQQSTLAFGAKSLVFFSKLNFHFWMPVCRWKWHFATQQQTLIVTEMHVEMKTSPFLWIEVSSESTPSRYMYVEPSVATELRETAADRDGTLISGTRRPHIMATKALLKCFPLKLLMRKKQIKCRYIAYRAPTWRTISFAGSCWLSRMSLGPWSKPIFLLKTKEMPQVKHVLGRNRLSFLDSPVEKIRKFFVDRAILDFCTCACTKQISGIFLFTFFSPASKVGAWPVILIQDKFVRAATAMKASAPRSFVWLLHRKQCMFSRTTKIIFRDEMKKSLCLLPFIAQTEPFGRETTVLLSFTFQIRYRYCLKG